eukprot:snap_masked-scaffold_24-processed-gene-4.19-mRNA-1 protein AED:1.00 eAED:1.00 QI:0/-1/0/0/-1/1/1/0/435
MKTDTTVFNSQEVYFRVYDFGGQEIFSSVHHIFINSNSLYFLVFNMAKLSNKDLQRLKFWCLSILKNAAKAPVILIGTFLRKYNRQNKEDKNLIEINKRISKFLKTLSSELNILENEQRLFFPLENSNSINSIEIKNTKDKVSSVVSGRAGIQRQNFLNFEVLTSWVLFMDNCREENNFATKKMFTKKASLCGFENWEVENMLEIYSEKRIISYFPKLSFLDNENFIFFTPSYFAQALGSFIRDKSFHELAFRIPSEKFSLYRKYVDTGILSKEIFNILLKEYSEKEKKYILELAIQTLILIPVHNCSDQYILPELLPPFDTKIKAPLTRDVDFVFMEYVLLGTFVKIINDFLIQEGVTQNFLYKGFCRIIFETEYIIDIFVSTDKSISFSLAQSSDLEFLNRLLEDLVSVFRTSILQKFEMTTRTNRDKIEEVV